jgi:hypothetical protein
VLGLVLNGALGRPGHGGLGRNSRTGGESRPGNTARRVSPPNSEKPLHLPRRVPFLCMITSSH